MLYRTTSNTIFLKRNIILYHGISHLLILKYRRLHNLFVGSAHPILGLATILGCILTALSGLLVLDYNKPIYAENICPGKPNDNDGDDISDNWEINGIDVNNDSRIDLDLKALGANYTHKDLFLELDYMKNHKPNTTAISMVGNAFANAPVCNADGTTGINLHILVDEIIPHQNIMKIVCKDIEHNWDGLNRSKFGTSEERNDQNSNSILSAKESIYHYGLFIHQFLLDFTPPKMRDIPTTTSGCADPPKMNFVVSLGGWGLIYGYNNSNVYVGNQGNIQSDVISNAFYEAGTLMHELGHTLGLGHGGNITDPVSYKPNYLSVMNYNFQFPSPIGNRDLDYSDCQMPTLNEGALNESTGVGDVCDFELAGQRTWIGWHKSPPSTVRCPPDKETETDEAYDWNQRNNITRGQFVKWNIDCNEDPKTRKDILETFKGYNDWANIRYIFNTSNGYAGGGLAGESVDAEANLINGFNIYGEPTAENILQDRVILLTNACDGAEKIIDPDIRGYYLNKLCLSNSTTISLPSNATSGVVVRNSTGSFSVSNATDITISSNATSGAVVSNATNISIPSNATSGVVVRNSTGSFSVSNATNISIPSNATSGVIVSNATNISIPSNATSGVVVRNSTGSFSVSNATNISIPSNATAGVIVSNATNISIPSNATSGVVVRNSTGSFIIGNASDISLPSNITAGINTTSSVNGSLSSNDVRKAVDILSDLAIPPDPFSNSSLGGISFDEQVVATTVEDELIENLANMRSVLERQIGSPNK